MKWIRICSAVIAVLSFADPGQAGLFDHGHAKSCDCEAGCEPECCKPVIEKPCHYNVYTYQRRCSDIKPPCCDEGCVDACEPADCGAPCGDECDSCDGHGHKLFGGHRCKLFGGKMLHKKGCDECCEPECGAPCDTCDGCGHGSWLSRLKCRMPKCKLPKMRLFGGHGHCDGCDEGCESCEGECCEPVDPCEIATLIYESQTACYADDREDAIRDLGNHYSCVCNPEIMCAFIYALNDADEDVRAQAADEIGDQLRENPCCCSPEIVSALTCALADCDDDVRDQAEEGLEACGYCVVDACCEEPCDEVCDDECDSCDGHHGLGGFDLFKGHRCKLFGGLGSCHGCDDACDAPCECAAPCEPGCAPADGGYAEPAAPADEDMKDAEPKDAPPAPADPKAHLPKKKDTRTARRSRNRLSNLFGLVD